MFGTAVLVQPLSVDFHPSLHLYSSGDVAGNVLLWRTNSTSVVAQYVSCSTCGLTPCTFPEVVPALMCAWWLRVAGRYRCKNVFPSTAGSLAGKESTTNFACSDRVQRVRFSPGGGTVLAVDGKGWMHTWHTTRPRDSILSMQVRARGRRGRVKDISRCAYSTLRTLAPLATNCCPPPTPTPWFHG